MQFTVTLAAAIALFTTINACKCGGNIDATRACCISTGGTPTSNDCPAGLISERLSVFAGCCRNLGLRSDCRCPIGCARNETDVQRMAQGLEPLNDEELLSFVKSYEDVEDVEG